MRKAADIDAAFTAMGKKPTEGFTVAADNLLYSQHRRIVELAALEVV